MKHFINDIIRPKIQGDGGEITYDSHTEDSIIVIMQGECSKCLILDRCIKWIEDEAEKEFGKRFTVKAIRKKPFFWDT